MVTIQQCFQTPLERTDSCSGRCASLCLLSLNENGLQLSQVIYLVIFLVVTIQQCFQMPLERTDFCSGRCTSLYKTTLVKAFLFAFKFARVCSHTSLLKLASFSPMNLYSHIHIGHLQPSLLPFSYMDSGTD